MVDDDPAVVEELEGAGIPAVRGDASKPGVLERAGAAEARVVVVLLHRIRDAEGALGALRDVPVLVRVFEEDDARWVRDRGGVPIPFSEAAADTVLAWCRSRLHEPPGPGAGGGSSGPGSVPGA